jgi:hypothetical protein
MNQNFQELNANAVKLALQSLGYYAEIISIGENCGDLDSESVINTNADKNMILKLFPQNFYENLENSSNVELIRLMLPAQSPKSKANTTSFITMYTNKPINHHSKEVICFYSHSKGKYQPLSNFYLSDMEKYWFYDT